MKSNTSERKNLIRTADSAPEVALELCLHGQFCLVACRFWVVLILVFFASWRAALGAETDSEIQPARGYSVSGFIEVHDLQQPKDGLFEREWKISRRTEFEVQAGGRFWRVVARYGPEHYEIYTGDGTNIYSYLVQEQTIRDEGFTTYPATVVPGTLPLNST